MLIPYILMFYTALNLMAVTNFRLTPDPTRYRMPLTHTNCSSRQHISEPILSEPHSLRKL